MSVAKSSLIMASGTVVSRALGFARAVLLAAMIVIFFHLLGNFSLDI